MNHKIRKQFAAFFLGCALLISSTPFMAQANPSSHSVANRFTAKRAQFKQTIKATARPYTRTRTTYPASYDLRSLGLLTPVKDQGESGLCWCFAACASMESNALKQGLGTYDLSEVHLGYFGLNGVKNPLPGLEGDTITYTGTYAWYENGAYSGILSRLMMNGYGPVSESDAPLSLLPSAPSESLAYGHNVLTLKQTYEINPGNRKAVKDALMQNGAVVCGMDSSVLDYNINPNPNFNFETDAYYVANSEYPDHDICIVGWDDNYSRNNFSTIKPAKNGAWLCRNSWGTEFGDYGYFWISYEDKGINNDTVYSYVVGPKDSYKKIYQYDGGMRDGYGYENIKAAANVFTATANDELVAISNYLDPTSGTISIYINPSSDNPASGTKVLSQKFTVTHSGFETFALTAPVVLTKGTKFSVVFTFNKPVFLHVDDDDDEESSDGAYYVSDITAHKGESFLLEKGYQTWDTSTDWNCHMKALTGNGSTLIATTAKSGSISILWADITGATGYDVFKKDASGQFTPLTTTPSNVTTYTDSDVTLGTTYEYKVSPKLSSGQPVELTTTGKAILLAPTGLKLRKSGKTLSLSWKKDNMASKYAVYRKVKGGSYKKVKTLSKTTFKDTNVKKGKTYYYYVVGIAANTTKSTKSIIKSITL
ncbi:Cysteine protease, C1A family [Lachnospiraceae bacterium XBB1006]|nr:Cysteine protease, C1A family [Lachnospiraceae bacterium XBB1006]